MISPAHPVLSAIPPGWGATCAGVLVATAMLGLPSPWLEATGVASLLASPTASSVRIGVALGAGLLAVVTIWAAVHLLGRDRALLAGEEGAPVLRRADAHPDAPARRPLSAAELVLPQEPVRAVDASSSTISSDILPVHPPSSGRAVAALAPGERLETFRLALPASRPPASEAPGIDALLRRLETRSGSA
jgi:hypothetical protein